MTLLCYLVNLWSTIACATLYKLAYGGLWLFFESNFTLKCLVLRLVEISLAVLILIKKTEIVNVLL